MSTRDNRRPNTVEGMLDVLVAGGLSVWAVAETARADDGPWLVLAGAAMAGCLFARRSRPFLATLVLAALMAAQALITDPPEQVWVLISVIIMSYSVGAFERSARRSLAGLAALALAVSLGIARDPSDTLSNVPPTLVIFMAAPWGPAARCTSATGTRATSPPGSESWSPSANMPPARQLPPRERGSRASSTTSWRTASA